MRLRKLEIVLWAAAGLALRPGPAPAEEPLKVCATVPDLGEIAREVGGDQVRVTVLAKGAQDPHFLEARPSFVKELSGADLYVQVGLDLEAGWAPALLRSARNGRILSGAPGFLDASRAVTPLGAPAGPVDRSRGDVHPQGNPHYLTDPLNGLKVARAVRDALAALRPEKKPYFEARCEDFARRLKAALVGERLTAKYDAEKLAQLAEAGKLEPFLETQGDGPAGGWIGRMAPFRGAPLVAEHDMWPYVAARFGLKIVGFLEPKPGLAPTTKHLGSVVEAMKAQRVRAVLAVAYFDPRHARFVARETGARVVPLAHQCGARPGTERYIDMVEHNVRELETALRGAP
ncbi:MAG: zinc ABC transporter substrate-binding protein [Planctomycetes bacterium]|nr:zinc ABC transporter substrate-binding protein [Planctomycetota bacterium]